ELRGRLVSAQDLAIRWLETRTEAELETYPSIVALARSVIAEAFSEKVITPGVTTTDDVAWYIRQRYADLGLPIWFMPYVNLQRPQTRRRPAHGRGHHLSPPQHRHTGNGIRPARGRDRRP